MDIIEVFDQFAVNDCYTIGGEVDLNRVNRRIEKEKKNILNLKISFGDIPEDCIFTRCSSSLTVPSMSKLTALLLPTQDREERIYNQFKDIQSLVIKDMFIRNVESLTLIKENMNNSPIYISDFHVFTVENKDITLDYIFFSKRKEGISNLFSEIIEKRNKKQNEDYLYVINLAKEEGLHTLEDKKMMVLKI